MLHEIEVEKYGPEGNLMAREIKTCVHCGFCLPACPTYRVLGEEMDSPRGRIFLMKEALEGKLALEEVMPYIDRCLGCLACVPACPSGVQYGELVTPFRSFAEEHRRRSLRSRMRRFLLRTILPFPGRFRRVAALARLVRPFRSWLPEDLRVMLELTPARLPAAVPLPAQVPARGRRRARVALLAGCVQQVLAPRINRATLELLAANGVEVVVPSGQNCCGALAMHTGESGQARRLAVHNFAVFPTDVDAIVTNAAGCGSGMKEYPLLFVGGDEEEQARAFAAKVQDVSVFLDSLGMSPPPALSRPLTLAYHDACHLAHAQGVREAPRRLLASIPNLTLLEVPEGELCCGSAGTYNIEEPEIARRLGEQKARCILETGAEAVAAGNIGCLVQIQTHLRALGWELPVYHTVEILAQACAPAAGSSK